MLRAILIAVELLSLSLGIADYVPGAEQSDLEMWLWLNSQSQPVAEAKAVDSSWLEALTVAYKPEPKADPISDNRCGPDCCCKNGCSCDVPGQCLLNLSGSKRVVVEHADGSRSVYGDPSPAVRARFYRRDASGNWYPPEWIEPAGTTPIKVFAPIQQYRRGNCPGGMCPINQPSYGLGRTSAVEQTPDQLLKAAGRAIGVRSIASGTFCPNLWALAHEQAAECARVGKQSHSLWGRQFGRFGARSTVCAESWPWEQSPAQAAPSMYASWVQSPGHWAAVNGSCSRYAYAMVQGRNLIWYACGVFA